MNPEPGSSGLGATIRLGSIGFRASEIRVADLAKVNLDEVEVDA
jgi:hypothetical protein